MPSHDNFPGSGNATLTRGGRLGRFTVQLSKSFRCSHISSQEHGNLPRSGIKKGSVRTAPSNLLRDR
jgi:hypothetical protein